MKDLASRTGIKRDLDGGGTVYLAAPAAAFGQSHLYAAARGDDRFTSNFGPAALARLTKRIPLLPHRGRSVVALE